MKANYVNSDHVHALITLPTNKTIEEIFQLLKGSSSHWINEKVNYKFRWAKGYSAFSASKRELDTIISYINSQGDHHRIKSFSEELKELMKKYNN